MQSSRNGFRTRIAAGITAATFGILVVMAGLSGPASANTGAGYVGPRSNASYDAVRCVQSAVGADVDGDFGPQTYRKIVEFQAANGLSADGIVGPLTGDVVLPRTFDPAFCAPHVPTTYEFVVDDTEAAAQPVNGGDLGAVVALGGSLPHCLAKGVQNHFIGGVRIAKVIWKRKLPTPKELFGAPNPVFFAGGVILCHTGVIPS